MARSYAPQIVLPAAMVAGFIGEKVFIGESGGKEKIEMLRSEHNPANTKD